MGDYKRGDMYITSLSKSEKRIIDEIRTLKYGRVDVHIRSGKPRQVDKITDLKLV